MRVAKASVAGRCELWVLPAYVVQGWGFGVAGMWGLVNRGVVGLVQSGGCGAAARAGLV